MMTSLSVSSQLVLAITRESTSRDLALVLLICARLMLLHMAFEIAVAGQCRITNIAH